MTARTVAARLLAAAAGIGSDITTSSLSPTVTLSASGAATSISSGVRVAPRRLSSTVIDTDNDPHFDYVGAIPGRMLVSNTDKTYPGYLTGGTSQSARNLPLYRFDYTGQAFEFVLRFPGNTLLYRIWVNDQPLTAAMVSVGVVIGATYNLKVDFGAAANHRVMLEVYDAEFGGVFIEPTASITKAQRENLLIAALGDSHTRGANGVLWPDTWLRRCANLLRADYANLAIGGSGYLIDDGTTGANFRNRLSTDVIPLNPDVLIVEGGWNDSALSASLVGAEAAYVFGVLRTALPNALIVAAGPWVVSHNSDSGKDAVDAALRSQATTAGLDGYISFRDPRNLTGSTPAWQQLTAYAVGDTVMRNGFPQTCVTGHTSTSSFDQTKWRSTAVVTGTGKVGSTAGDGSADVIVSNDGAHATAVGHQVKARFYASELCRVAAAAAADGDSSLISLPYVSQPLLAFF